MAISDLTKRNGDVITVEGLRQGAVIAGQGVWGVVAEKLNRYECTGLKPEQLDDFARQVSVIRNAVGCKTLEDCYELARGNRLLVLPCKVGDTVFRVWKVDGRKAEITEHKMENIVQIAQWLHLFGKTVFALRADAEAYAEKEESKNVDG